MKRTVTQAAADFLQAFESAEVPGAAADLIKLATLDCVGCMVVGSASRAATILSDWLSEMGGRPEAVVVGRGFRAPAVMAALVNGTAGHALDFDDMSPTMNHPSVVLLPALLALSEKIGVSGRDFIAAYLAGFEVFARLCRAMNPPHYYRGWHATSTIGTLGAAAAASKLLRLDGAQTRMALGIAASNAAGIRQNFGSMVKPLHAGQAASNGAYAALLAQRGYSADLSALDGPQGFISVFGGTPEVSVEPAVFDDGPLEILTSGIGFKRFACCGAIHTGIDAMLELVEHYQVDPKQVRGIEYAVNRRAPEILIHSRPQTPLESKFSMEYSLAIALVDRWAGLPQYTEERQEDPLVRDLMSRVRVSVDATFPHEYATFPAAVTVHMTDGRKLSSRVDVPRGYPTNPLTPEELHRKFRECCANLLGPSVVEEAIRMIESLAEVPDVRQLTSLILGTASERVVA